MQNQLFSVKKNLCEYVIYGEYAEFGNNKSSLVLKDNSRSDIYSSFYDHITVSATYILIIKTPLKQKEYTHNKTF